jgi:hypothetical protein
MPGPGMAAMTTAESRNKKKFAAAHLYSMIRKSGYRFFPRDKRGTRLRGDHAQTTTLDHDPIMI